MVTRIRASLSRRRWPIAWTTALTVLTANAAIQTGVVALVIVLMAGVGCFVTVTVVAAISGKSAAQHSLITALGIERAVSEAKRKKELTR